MEKMDSDLKTLDLEDFMKFISLVNYYREKVPKLESMQVAEQVEWPLLASNNVILKDMSLSNFASLFVKGREICVKSIGPCKAHVEMILADLAGN